MRKEYNIISPDSITIRNENFASKRDAINFYNNIWKKRFESQGYYSSNRGRIPLDALDDFCEWFVEETETEEDEEVWNIRFKPDGGVIREKGFHTKDDAINYFNNLWKSSIVGDKYHARNGKVVPKSGLDSYAVFVKLVEEVNSRGKDVLRWKTLEKIETDKQREALDSWISHNLLELKGNPDLAADKALEEISNKYDRLLLDEKYVTKKINKRILKIN